MSSGWALILLTVLLVVAGSALHVAELVGFAQLLFVLASGTAGGGIVLILEERR